MKGRARSGGPELGLRPAAGPAGEGRSSHQASSSQGSRSHGFATARPWWPERDGPPRRMAGPYYIRGISRFSMFLGCPRFASDAKRASFEPRNASRITEEPLPGVRGRTEGEPRISRIRPFLPARDQNPVRTEEPRQTPRISEESPTGGPTGYRQGTKDAWMTGLPAGGKSNRAACTFVGYAHDALDFRANAIRDKCGLECMTGRKSCKG